MSFVYLLTFKDGQHYVGKTQEAKLWHVESRYRAMVNHSKSDRPVEVACRAQGMPTISILELCSPEKLEEREALWIEAYDSPLNVERRNPQFSEKRIAARVHELLHK